MTFEIADEGVIVSGEKADEVIFFRRGVEDCRSCVGEAREMTAVLLTRYVL